MVDPLIKRLPREFKSDLGKYAVIFLFMVMLISIVSGDFVASKSMLAAYNNGFEKYNVEHGHIAFDKLPPDELLRDIEEKAGVKFYDLSYFEEDSDSEGKTSRVYVLRDDVDLECVMQGALPTAKNEIAIDRMFAENNKLSVGDVLTLNGKDLVISGFVAFPDYSCLYEKNTDMMFDALNFNVGVMTREGFDSVGSKHFVNNYAWMYNSGYDRDDLVRAAKLFDDFMDVLVDCVKSYDENIVEEQAEQLKSDIEAAAKEYAEIYMKTGKAPTADDLSVSLDSFVFGVVEDMVSAQIKGEEYTMPPEEDFENCIDKTNIVGVKDCVPQHLNMAINFTGDDLGGDMAMMVVFAYVVIAVLAFIFAVTTSNTIAAEAGVIGTLRASGYSRGELIRHYLILPTAITLLSAVVGNILGYAWFEKVAADLYYASYSLCTYEVMWNAEAFVITTVVPIVLMLIINFFMISSKMKLSPLDFLRRDLKKSKRKKAFRLNTKLPFLSRFSIRILFQNMPGYIVMIAGIILGAVIIIFGTMFEGMFADYSEQVLGSMICDYQYILTESAETESDSAEKYCITSYEFKYKDYVADNISVFGVEDDSRYISADIDSTAVSNVLAAKYQLGIGDSITLTDKYDPDKSYTFTIGSIYTYDAGLAVFIPRERFNKMFGMEEDYYTGYFSTELLDDLDPDAVAGIIHAKDYTKLVDQLNVSVGGFMKYVGIFGVIMFILIMYILSKQVIERNFQSISMCKILGFRNGEIGGLYIVSTSAAVIIGLLAAIPLTEITVNQLFEVVLYRMMSGYFPCSIATSCYVRMVVLGIFSYAVVAVLQMIKIGRISKSEALKNRE